MTILVATVVLSVTTTLVAPALYRMRHGHRTSAAIPEPDTEPAEILTSDRHATGHDGR